MNIIRLHSIFNLREALKVVLSFNDALSQSLFIIAMKSFVLTDNNAIEMSIEVGETFDTLRYLNMIEYIVWYPKLDN